MGALERYIYLIFDFLDKLLTMVIGREDLNNLTNILLTKK